MPTLPSRASLQAVFRASIQAAPVSLLNPAVVDVAGSDLNLIAGASSLEAEECIAALARALQGLFVQTAAGSALDRIAYDRYGLTRFPATPATTDLTLSRAAPGAAGTYAAGSRVQSASGIQFATDTDAVFGAGDLTVTVGGTALLTGPDGNVVANTIVQFVDSCFDPAMTVTNTAAAGGADVEIDANFRARIFDYFRTIRRGVLGAIEFAARTVPGIAVATAYEVVNPGSGFPAAVVELIVADANGGSSSSLVRQVRSALLEFRAGGIEVDVSGGTVVYQTVHWHNIAFQAGIDESNATAELAAVTIAVTQFLAPGETLLRSSLIAAARTVPGVVITDSSLAYPLGDVLAPNNNTLFRVLQTGITID
jgi:uncharacterized phage protein gp47/JayE